MEQNGISKLDLKRRNRMQIIKLLQQQGPTSRIDLSALLELTRAAVTIITNEMIEQGVLYEKGEVSTVGQKASRGRKKILIDINRNYKFAFGIALDHKKIFIGLSNIGGEVLEKRVYELRANDTKESMMQQIFINMREMMTNNCLTEQQILGAGICLNRRAIRFLNLKVEQNVVDYSSLERMFVREFHMPVVFDSIITGLAAAEIDFSGKYPPDKSAVVIRFADNVDATLVVDNEIYRGYHNNAMNLGHMIVNPDGKPCRCGKRGCAVCEFSDESVYVDIVNMFSKEKTPNLFAAKNGNPNLLRVAEVHEYVLLGDEGVEELFDQMLKSFVLFLNNLIAITDPQRIIFCGHQFENEEFMKRLKEYVARELGSEIADMVAASYLSQEHIYLSGCALAIRRFFVERGGFGTKAEE